jgi:phosphopantothenoylcysteine decarboxylase / phosphopantothenate---cysteine ligase
MAAKDNQFKNAHVAIGVTGSIAAYKSCELVSRLKQNGAQVRIIMTRSARKLVGEITFSTLSGNPVASDMFPENTQFSMPHISISDWADIVVIAPATANIIGKTAAGIADDLLSTILMAANCPLIFAPAMNSKMFENRVLQHNLQKLKDLGYFIIGPESGYLACGYEGKGRLASIETILENIQNILLNRQKD